MNDLQSYTIYIVQYGYLLSYYGFSLYVARQLMGKQRWPKMMGILLTLLVVSGCGQGSSEAATTTTPLSLTKAALPTTETETSPTPTIQIAASATPLIPADIIFYNGDVITLEEEGVVEAIAIKGDRILAVGTNADILKLQNDGTNVIDLEGRAVLPGFFEGHSHILGGSQQADISLEEAQEIALSYGWTSLSELSLPSDAIFHDLTLAEDTGSLRIRVNGFIKYNRARIDGAGENEVIEFYWRDNPPILDSDRFFRVVGIKIFVDGTFNGIGRGCPAVTEAFPEGFQEHNAFVTLCQGKEFGSLYVTQEQLNAVLKEVQQAGYRAAMHARGDRAIDAALDAIEFALNGESNEKHRHQIHHNELIRPDQIPRYQQLNVLASLRGTFTSCRVNRYPFFFGEERYEFAANYYELATLLPHAFAEGDFAWTKLPEDAATANPINPLQNLWGFVTYKQVADDGSICEPLPWAAKHEITVEEGLRLLTIAPAYAVSQEDVLGTLLPGKFADIVILDRNPLSVDPDEIIELSVLLTMVGGNAEFCRGGSEFLCP